MPLAKHFYHKMNYWYNSPLGRLLLKTESDVMADFLGNIFGYHLLQLNGPKQSEFLNSSPIAHKIYFSSELPSVNHDSSVQGEFTELPFLPDSVDLAVAAHVLEFIEQPKKILNELYHLLIPEGYLIIIGFNPFSLWGLKRLFATDKITPWNGKFISAFSVRHWLSKAGFKIIDTKTFLFRPPLLNNEMLKKLLFIETVGRILWPYCGGGYLILAKKQLSALTPIKQRKIRQRMPVVGSYAKPTTSIHNEKS